MSKIDLSTRGICAHAPFSHEEGGAKMEPLSFQRHEPGPHDIVIDVKYCGVCHSDLHHVEGPNKSNFPAVPGHEISGIATFVGDQVKKDIKVGTKIGVGCMVDACLECEYCLMGDEQYCEKGASMTYGSEPKHGHCGTEKTRGGYSNQMVVHEAFAIILPEDMPLEMAGVIMCAGITMYDPLVRYNAGSEHVKRVGIVGGGGLGHMGIKLAKSLGCEVTAITTSPSKAEHLKNIGATHVVISTNEEDMKAHASTVDLILNTVSAPHDVMSYVALLRTHGVIVQLGLVEPPHNVPQVPLLFKHKSISGSLIGGVQRTQDLINLCASKKVYPDIKVVPCTEINRVFTELTQKSTTVQRYVLDIAGTLGDFCSSAE